MKNIIKTLFMAVAMAVCCQTAFAQTGRHPAPDGKERMSREQLAETQARHIASELAFSDEITEKFVTTYCDCQKEIWALGPRHPESKGNTERDNEQRIKQRFETSEKVLSIRQKYYKKYSKFLTQTQIEKVYEQERKMMKRLSDRRNNGNKPAKPSKRK